MTVTEKEYTKLERRLKTARDLISSLKEEAANTEFYRQKYKAADTQKKAEEYNAYIYKLQFDAIAKGLELNGSHQFRIEDEEKLITLDKGLRGISKDAEGKEISQVEFMQQNISDFCKLNKGDNKVVNPKVIGYVEVLKQHAGLEVTDLNEFCAENQNLLPGFQSPVSDGEVDGS